MFPCRLSIYLLLYLDRIASLTLTLTLNLLYLDRIARLTLTLTLTLLYLARITRHGLGFIGAAISLSISRSVIPNLWPTCTLRPYYR